MPEYSVWSVAGQVKNKAIQAPAHMGWTVRNIHGKLKDADRKRSRLMIAAMDAHCKYYEKVSGLYEHWRYADGWHLGWTDGRAFFSARLDRVIPCSAISGKDQGSDLLEKDVVLGADRLGQGMVDLWITKRMAQEMEVQREGCEFMWEWERGFRDGLDAFYHTVGIS